MSTDRRLMCRIRGGSQAHEGTAVEVMTILQMGVGSAVWSCQFYTSGGDEWRGGGGAWTGMGGSGGGEGSGR